MPQVKNIGFKGGGGNTVLIGHGGGFRDLTGKGKVLKWPACECEPGFHTPEVMPVGIVDACF